jgi:hypothetical protein
MIPQNNNADNLKNIGWNENKNHFTKCNTAERSNIIALSKVCGYTENTSRKCLYIHKCPYQYVPLGVVL